MSRLEARSVALSYDARTAVIEGLNLRIPDRSITGIIGPNGCGKSTLLRALARLLRPRYGSVILDGTEIQQQSTKKVARRLGLLQQHSEAPEAITVEDLVRRGRYPHRSFLQVSLPDDDMAVAAALATAGVAELSNRLVDELSGGQRQRVWIAMALAQETPILLLDEPTTYLDLSHRRDTLQLLHRLHAEHGRSIVVVLHDVNDAAELCDTVVAMRDGAIVEEGPVAEVLHPELLTRLFGVACDLLPRPGGWYAIPKSGIEALEPLRPSSAATLQLEGLRTGYGDRTVIHNVSLDIPTGQITAIVGPNASGKSTLLKTIAGLLPAHAGSVLCEGRPIASLPRRAFARKLSFLEQSGDVPAGVTVEELVAVGRHPYQRWYRQWSRVDRAVIRRSLEAVGIAELCDLPVRSLSGGQQRRVFIAMALAQDTDIVLLDEPTAFLDIAHQSEVLDRIAELNRHEQRTVVAVLHDLWQASRYADYVVVMDAGRIRAAGSPQEVLTPAVVRDTFGVAAALTPDPGSSRTLVLPSQTVVRSAAADKGAP